MVASTKFATGPKAIVAVLAGLLVGMFTLAAFGTQAFATPSPGPGWWGRVHGHSAYFGEWTIPGLKATPSNSASAWCLDPNRDNPPDADASMTYQLLTSYSQVSSELGSTLTKQEADALAWITSSKNTTQAVRSASIGLVSNDFLNRDFNGTVVNVDSLTATDFAVHNVKDSGTFVDNADAIVSDAKEIKAWGLAQATQYPLPLHIESSSEATAGNVGTESSIVYKVVAANGNAVPGVQMWIDTTASAPASQMGYSWTGEYNDSPSKVTDANGAAELSFTPQSAGDSSIKIKAIGTGELIVVVPTNTSIQRAAAVSIVVYDKTTNVSVPQPTTTQVGTTTTTTEATTTIATLPPTSTTTVPVEVETQMKVNVLECPATNGKGQYHLYVVVEDADDSHAYSLTFRNVSFVLSYGTDTRFSGNAYYIDLYVDANGGDKLTGSVAGTNLNPTSVTWDVPDNCGTTTTRAASTTTVARPSASADAICTDGSSTSSMLAVTIADARADVAYSVIVDGVTKIAERDGTKYTANFDVNNAAGSTKTFTITGGAYGTATYNGTSNAFPSCVATTTTTAATTTVPITSQSTTTSVRGGSCESVTQQLTSLPDSTTDALTDKLIYWGGKGEQNEHLNTDPVPLLTPFPAGTYSFAAVSGDPSHPTTQQQYDEQWFAIFTNGATPLAFPTTDTANVVGISPVTPELAEADTIKDWGVIGNVTFTGTATHVIFVHARVDPSFVVKTPNNGFTGDSIRPVRMTLKRIDGSCSLTTTTTTTMPKTKPSVAANAKCASIGSSDYTVTVTISDANDNQDYQVAVDAVKANALKTGSVYIANLTVSGTSGAEKEVKIRGGFFGIVTEKVKVTFPACEETTTTTTTVVRKPSVQPSATCPDAGETTFPVSITINDGATGKTYNVKIGSSTAVAARVGAAYVANLNITSLAGAKLQAEVSGGAFGSSSVVTSVTLPENCTDTITTTTTPLPGVTAFVACAANAASPYPIVLTIADSTPSQTYFAKVGPNIVTFTADNATYVGRFQIAGKKADVIAVLVTGGKYGVTDQALSVTLGDMCATTSTVRVTTPPPVTVAGQTVMRSRVPATVVSGRTLANTGFSSMSLVAAGLVAIGGGALVLGGMQVGDKRRMKNAA